MRAVVLISFSTGGCRSAGGGARGGGAAARYTMRPRRPAALEALPSGVLELLLVPSRNAAACCGRRHVQGARRGCARLVLLSRLAVLRGDGSASNVRRLLRCSASRRIARTNLRPSSTILLEVDFA
eukprot:scaffold49882_cov69-Phaeocystis_antarctica.AAC.2